MLQKYVNLRTLKVFWFFFLFLIRKIDGKVPEHSKLRHTHRRDAKVSEYFLMKYPVDRSSYSEEMHNKRFCVAYAPTYCLKTRQSLELDYLVKRHFLENQ